MKKNYLFGLLSLFTLLFAASCQEEEMAGSQYGDTATVTFQVSTPMLATRAVGDGTTATKLYVAVYENQNGSLQGPLEVSLIDEGETVTFNDRVATVNLALAKNKEYSVIFWAETANAEEAMSSIDWQNRELNIKNELKANQESYDAFWAQKTVKLTGALSEKVELKRPFAQLNIGTSDKVAAEAAGIVVEQTKVKTTVFTTFNLQTGEASGEAEVTYTMAAISDIEGETFPADADNQSYLSLNYLLMNTDKSIVDVEFQYQDAEDEAPYTLSFPSVPVQRNYRTNIYGTLLTNSANYTVEIKPGFGNAGKEDVANIVYVTTAEEMIAALAADKASIEVRLLNDIELPISKLGQQTPGSGEYKLGNENTDSITFDLNGKKLNITTTYWSAIGAKNADALITIKNGTMTSSQETGTWNSYDLTFANCNYVIKDVTFEKAIAFTNASKKATLTDVTINETHDYYAMWISAEGQTVDIDNLTINSDGRGIKIDEQYVGEDEVAKVTLNVKNAKFNTEKKAAIMVKSAAGANITLENLDLTGVKADGFNAVWVDADSKDHADKVTVTGGFKAVEGDKAATDAANPFLVENATVPVAKGVYSALPKVANGVTIVAEEGTVFTGTSSVSGKNVTIKNVTFTNTDKVVEKEYRALTGSLTGTVFENCHFDAKHGARYCYAYGDVVFNDCTFGDENCVRGVHFDAGDGTVTFNRCTIYGFTALGGSVKKMTFNDCEFPYNNRYNVVNMYNVYEFNNCKFNPSMHTDCAGNGVVATFNKCSYTDGKSIYSLVRFDKDPATCTITFDGKLLIATSAQLKSAVAAGHTDICMLAGTYDTKDFGFMNKTLYLKGVEDGVKIYNSQNNAVASGSFDMCTVTFENLTIETRGGNYKGFARMNGTYRNCTIVNNYFTCYGKHEFVDCTFNAPALTGSDKNEHCMWTYGAEEVDFVNCKFNYSDRCVNVYVDNGGNAPGITSDVAFTNCVFNTENTASEGAVEVNSTPFTAGVKVTLNGCTAPTYGKMVYVSPWDGTKGKTATITVDGEIFAGLESALANAVAGSTIVLSEGADLGEVTVGELKDVTIKGAEGTVMIFKTTADTKIENVTLQNVNFAYTGATADCGIVINENAQIDNLVLEGCTFIGTGAKAGRGLAYPNKNATIEIKGCTFKDLGYPIWAFGTYKELTIEGCTFDNIKSWAIMPQSGFDGDLTVTGCTFKNCLGGGLIKAGTLTAGHTFTFTDNTITGCTVAGDHNWFQFNVSAGTSVISGNTKDGADWTPTAADGLK